MKIALVNVLMLILLTSIAGCGKAGFPEGVPEGQVEVLLNECSPAHQPFSICLDSVISDSRCPAGAVCVWQGEATVEVSFHENNRRHTFRMSIGAPAITRLPSDTVVAGYNIVFKDLKPYPGTITAQNAGRRTAYFMITQAN